MKTIVRFYMAGCLVLANVGYVAAQSAASSSKDVTGQPTQTTPSTSVSTVNRVSYQELNQTKPVEEYRNTRGIPMTPEMERLVGEGKTQEALIEFEKLKKLQPKASKFDLLYLEMTIYREAAFNDPQNAAEYAEKEKDMIKMLIEQFPNESDAVLLQITPQTSNDDIIKITTKAIELDQTNLFAYEQRGRVLYMIGKTKEACADFEKLPYKNTLPEYQWCKGLNQ